MFDLGNILLLCVHDYLNDLASALLYFRHPFSILMHIFLYGASFYDVDSDIIVASKVAALPDSFLLALLIWKICCLRMSTFLCCLYI